MFNRKVYILPPPPVYMEIEIKYQPNNAREALEVEEKENGSC